MTPEHLFKLAEERRKLRRFMTGLSIALGASLGLNLFLIVVLAALR